MAYGNDDTGSGAAPEVNDEGMYAGQNEDDEQYQNMAKFVAQRKAYAQKLQGQLNAPLGQGLNDEQLQNISAIESSGGRDLRHPTATKGVNAGSTAYGQFGLMPNTIRGTAEALTNKQSELYKSLPPEIEEPDVAALRDLDDTQLKAKLQANPDLANKVARLTYQDTVAKHGNNPLVNQYTWLQGPNTPEAKITPEAMTSNDILAGRAQKLIDLQNKNQQDVPQEQTMDPRFQKVKDLLMQRGMRKNTIASRT